MHVPTCDGQNMGKLTARVRCGRVRGSTSFIGADYQRSAAPPTARAHGARAAALPAWQTVVHRQAAHMDHFQLDHSAVRICLHCPPNQKRIHTCVFSNRPIEHWTNWLPAMLRRLHSVPATDR